MVSEIDKLIVAMCVIFGIMTAIIISNKWHNAKSLFERIIGDIFASIGFFWVYLITIHIVLKYLLVINIGV